MLRDIIDLEATYAGPDAKTMQPPVIGPDGQPVISGAPIVAGQPLKRPAPAKAPASATPLKSVPERESSEERCEEGALAEGDLDEDDLEGSLLLAAIEAELKPRTLETFDKIADRFKRLRRLQDQDIPFWLISRETPGLSASRIRRPS